jgi:hypothetical protein
MITEDNETKKEKPCQECGTFLGKHCDEKQCASLAPQKSRLNFIDVVCLV